MKTSLRLLAVTTACSFLFSGDAAFAQGTAFIYQGRLTDGGAPAIGSYDFQCQLYTRATPGEPGDAQVSGTVTSLAAPVTNGLFALSLDFGAAPFNGEDRWLLIRLRTNNALNYVNVFPRQRLAPTPYAIYTGTASNLAAGVSQTFTGPVSFNPASGPPFTVGNANKVPNLNADLIDGIDSPAFMLKAGDTMTGNLTLAPPANLGFGNQVRQMLNLWGLQYGIGVQAASLYFRTDGGYAWFRGGIHADGTFDPGGGTTLMTLDSGGQLQVNASGVTAVTGVSGLSGGNGVVGEANNGPSAYGVWGRSTDGYAGVFTSASGYAGQFNGAVRVNFASPFNKPQLEIADPANSGFARLRMKTGTQSSWDIAVGTTSGVLQTNSLRFYSDGNGDVMTLATNGNLFVRVITITGGADIAEPFKMSSKELQKGSVVVIDEDHPGQLKPSTEPYDTRVAGVISGANGVNPGLALNQEGILDGDQPVALTGRVYVQADASFGAIKPGDLLTTSATPGHAMKVTDSARAQGAILGKAMTGLKEGQNLVLVLVTLQ